VHYYIVAMSTVVTRYGRISKKPDRLDPEEEVEDDYTDDDEDFCESDDEDLCESDDDEEEDDEEDADENGNLKGFVVSSDDEDEEEA
jgi:hypothetical protein